MKNTALITGASGGIGLALAREHAAKGGDLVLVSRDKNKLDEIKNSMEKEFGVSIYTIVKDLSVTDSAREVYEEVAKQNIQVEILINDAGFGDYGFFTETEWEKEAQMINLNIVTLTLFTKLYLVEMVKRGSGKIMNVASTAAFQPGPLMAVYYATKTYVLNFSEAINNEVKGSGVTVTTLCPGPTQTGFAKAADSLNNPIFKDRKLPTPKDVAHYGYSSMMRGKAVAIHGFKNYLLTLTAKLLPRALIVLAVRQAQDKIK